MKKVLYSIIVALGVLMPARMCAQQSDAGVVGVDSVSVEWKPYLDIRMRLDLTPLKVKAGEAVEVIPLLAGEQDTLELPRVLVTGRTRALIYERNGRRTQRDYQQVIRRRNGTEQQVDYFTNVRAEQWMDGARLLLLTDVCGCGWRSLDKVHRQELVRVEAPHRPEFEPLLAFIVPECEEVKVRAKSGQAFLDFPVNRTEIHPDYRNNPRELEKIKTTIQSVRTDKYATITGVSIKGYASPEGSYAANARLAEGRAKALLEYVKGLYDFGQAQFAVSSEPEDWAGLDSLVAASQLAEREEILAIIRDPEIKDPDARDHRLKRLAGERLIDTC